MEEEASAFSNIQIEPDQLPRWQAIEFEPLAPAAPWPPFWSGSISLCLFLVATTVAVITSPLTFPLFLTFLLAGIAFFLLSQWLSFAEYRRRGVALREKDIAFRRGLFWQQQTVLPFCRVQHIEIHRGPIERKLGLSSLRLFTAGGSGVDLQISGLEQERAERIKQFILDKTKSESSDVSPDERS